MTESTVKSFFIGPQDNWKEIVDGTSTAITFLRISAVPHTHQFLLFAGANAPSLVTAFASEDITIVTKPTANDTITIGSITYTFVASATTVANQVTIGAAKENSLANLIAAINAGAGSGTAYGSATVANPLATAVAGITDHMTVTATANGSAGNAVATTQSASDFTLPHATLTGGLDVDTSSILMCHKPFWMNVSDGSKWWIRVPNPVPNSYNADGRLRVDVFANGGTVQ